MIIKCIGKKCWEEGVFRAADFFGADYEMFVLFPDSTKGVLCDKETRSLQRPIYHKPGEACQQNHVPLVVVRGGAGPEPSGLPQVDKNGKVR